MEAKFDPHFPLQHQQKDLRLAICMADTVDQPLHVGAAANEVGLQVSSEGIVLHSFIHYRGESPAHWNNYWLR